MTCNTIPDIEFFSEGGAEPNPAKGGLGVILSYKGKHKEFSHGYQPRHILKTLFHTFFQ
jgi:ribonuclease HI